jgi:cation:H+ antiporter
MAVPSFDPVLLSEMAVAAVALYTLVTAAGRAIDALLGLARYYDVPDVLIGLTVVAIGTSLPEISSHVTASFGILSGVLDYRITSAVVIGGNMGSSTTQQLLLVGVLVIGYGRMEISRRTIVDSFVPMAVALLLTLALAWDGSISRIDGLVLLIGYVAYLVYSYARRQRTVNPGGTSSNVTTDGVIAIVMLALVLASASVLLAVIQGVVEGVLLGGSMIGVLTLGTASSFPEMSTVLDGIRRKTPVIALGTLVGSNVVNPLIGLGLGGVISTYYVPTSVIVWDLPFKILATVALLAHLHYRDGVLTRRSGMYLVGLYFVYIAGRMLLFPGQ